MPSAAATCPSACIASHAVNPLSGDYSIGQRNYRRAMRDRIIHLAEMADLFSAPHICIYSFKRPLERITAIHRVDNAVFLADMSEICARRGKVLLVANAPRTLTSTCAELADLMQRCIPPSLRISWDIVSGWRSGEIPWGEGVFEPIADYVMRVHTAGARAKPDGSFAAFTIPGSGNVSHKEIFQKLLKSGFDGTIAIDPHYGQFAEADQLTGIADPIVEVLRRSLAYLQDLLKQLPRRGVSGFCCLKSRLQPAPCFYCLPAGGMVLRRWQEPRPLLRLRDAVAGCVEITPRLLMYRATASVISIGVCRKPCTSTPTFSLATNSASLPNRNNFGIRFGSARYAGIPQYPIATW